MSELRRLTITRRFQNRDYDAAIQQENRVRKDKSPNMIQLNNNAAI